MPNLISRSFGGAPATKNPSIWRAFLMELAGLEPATSWVRCIAGPQWRVSTGRESPIILGDSAYAPTARAGRAGTHVPVWYPRLSPSASPAIPAESVRRLEGGDTPRIRFAMDRSADPDVTDPEQSKGRPRTM